ncbi:hypothetical protein ABZ864_10840 [Streptomyces sp. NPDC047082]|uniref:hypothetical protein n=1 Tax=Streptomyces sp. NPDC047082 TaxID=3155259 RepID=UPI0033DB57A3
MAVPLGDRLDGINWVPAVAPEPVGSFTFGTDAWSSPPAFPDAAPESTPAAGDFLADAWRATPPAATEVPELPSATAPAPADPDDAAAGLRKAQWDHLPDITLAALRWACANDPDFPGSVDKRGTELLSRR